MKGCDANSDLFKPTLQTQEKGFKYKLTKTPERHFCCSCVYILTLNIFHISFSSVSIVDFEQVNN